ncbi:hypothetical protein BDZ89DRAFT_1043695 [Hymenopellis radicata]|nr:hypothetical protein BDZ89DRAFT_1043695 [Hymenopellis radicata]
MRLFEEFCLGHRNACAQARPWDSGHRLFIRSRNLIQSQQFNTGLERSSAAVTGDITTYVTPMSELVSFLVVPMHLPLLSTTSVCANIHSALHTKANTHYVIRIELPWAYQYQLRVKTSDKDVHGSRMIWTATTFSSSRYDARRMANPSGRTSATKIPRLNLDSLSMIITDVRLDMTRLKLCATPPAWTQF